MTARISHLRRIVDTLQEIIDEADSRGIDKIQTVCNTYGLTEFVSLGSDGFIDIDADIDDLLEDDVD